MASCSVWRGAARLGWPFGPALQLLALTGARREEIGALRWSEIRGDQIELPGARTKNGQAHVIPLSKMASAIIAKLPRIAESEFVFTTTGAKPVSGWAAAKARLDEYVPCRLGAFTTCAARSPPVCSGLASACRLSRRFSIMCGSRAGIVGVYQRHTFDAEKRAALDAWARHVEAIVSGKPVAVARAS